MASTGSDTELKARHRKMWASGDYASMVETFLLPLGPRLVEACGIGPGMSVLDVAAGTGNASLPAAQTGARVTASDLTPELLEAGRRRAEAAGSSWSGPRPTPSELPFEDESFDVVMSCIGAMFAPRHQDVADELVRVCRRGGTIGMLNWTPEGMIGALFRDDGPVRPAAAARRAAAAAVGRRGPRARAVRRPRRAPHARARHARDHRVRAPARLRRALQGQVRPDDRRAGGTRARTAARTSSSRPSTGSATSGTSARRSSARFEQEYLVVVGKRA